MTRKAFPTFEVTLIVAVILIGWVAFVLYQIGPQVDRSRKQLSDLYGEYFQIAEFLQSNLNESHGALTNFLAASDAASGVKFEARNQEFQKWIEKENERWNWAVGPPANPGNEGVSRSSPGTSRPGQLQVHLALLLSDVANAYTNYQRAARFLINSVGKTVNRERLAQREQGLQRSKGRLMTLARQARMRGEAIESVLAGTQQRYGNLEDRFQRMGFALLLALIVLSFLLMLGIYRGKMAQTRHIIQQHKRQHLEQEAKLDKLAHFGRLARELAHEIKQPLTAITARIYTLRKLLPVGTDTYKDAVVIGEEIKRLDRILKDFLELARPSEPHLLPVAADQALEEIRDLMAPQLEQDSVALKFACEEDLKVLADSQQLKQVLINLAKNAAESMRGNGTLTLSARKSHRQLHGEDTETVILEVGDTGPGIPPNIQDRIFDPFFSTKEDGTGLGLAIAAGIVDKHGGSLEFETEPGKGTTFRIVLPAVEQSNHHEQGTPHRG